VAGTRTDPEAARRLLAEAGFPEGRGLPPIPLLARNDGHLPKVAEAIQEMWRRIGVTATIEVVEQKTWLEQQQQGAHTAALLGWVADYADPLTFLGLFVTGGGNNWTGWADAAYDGLLAEARETADPAARAALLRRAETRLLEEAPVTPLVHGAQTYLLDPAVRGWEPAPLGLHRFQRIAFAAP
jgi:oligopeptide transport system substrate-binding protein